MWTKIVTELLPSASTALQQTMGRRLSKLPL
jgi:hypothetical protein